MDDETVEGVEADEFGTHDWLTIVGGGLFFVAGLLVWWKFEFSGIPVVSKTAFGYTITGIVPWVIFVTIAIVTTIVRSRSLPVPDSLVHPVLVLILSSVATALVVLRFFDSGFSSGTEGVGDSSRGLGMYLGLFSAVLVLAGAVLAFREHSMSLEDADLLSEPDPRNDPTPRRPERPPLP